MGHVLLNQTNECYVPHSSRGRCASGMPGQMARLCALRQRATTTSATESVAHLRTRPPGHGRYFRSLSGCKSLRSCQAAAIIAGAPWTSVCALGQRENTPYAVCLCYSAAAAAKIRQKKAEGKKKKGRLLRNSGHFRTPYNLPFLCPSVGTLGCGEKVLDDYYSKRAKKKKGTGTTSTGGRGYSRGGRHGLFFFY